MPHDSVAKGLLTRPIEADRMKPREVVQLFNKLFLILLLSTSTLAVAQSAPAAEGAPFSIWAGAEASNYNPDWSCPSSSPFSCESHQLAGFAVFADTSRIIGRFGAEAEGRWLHWRGPVPKLNQTDYLAGPRYQVYATSRFSANVKLLAGTGTLDSPYIRNYMGTFFAYVPGATISFRTARRWMVRADYEYQRWPEFAGDKGRHGLTPNGFSLGFSYRVF